MAMLILLAAAAGVLGQDPCSLSDSSDVDCESLPSRTTLPTFEQYGNHNVDAITGSLLLRSLGLTEIQDGRFAQRWIKENEENRPVFNQTRRDEQGILLEEVGVKLRKMMPFLDAVEIKPGE